MGRGEGGKGKLRSRSNQEQCQGMPMDDLEGRDMSFGVRRCP